MTVFRPDCLAFFENGREIRFTDHDSLAPLRIEDASQMLRKTRLNRATCFKLAEIEAPFQFAIDAREQIQIESRGNAQRIVVGVEKLRKDFSRSVPSSRASPGCRMCRMSLRNF